MDKKNIKLDLNKIVSDDTDKDTLKNKLLDIGFEEIEPNEIQSTFNYPQPLDGEIKDNLKSEDKLEPELEPELKP